MNRMKKLMSALLVVAMVLSMVACGGNETPAQTESAVTGETATYTVSVETAGGMSMEGVDVYIYADNTLTAWSPLPWKRAATMLLWFPAHPRVTLWNPAMPLTAPPLPSP